MTGDQQDVFNRLKSALPPWFGDSSPFLDAVLQGLAWAGSFIYSLYAYAVLQTRILTATDGWLDVIAADFFGTNLLRKTNQSDASFRNQIVINIFRERATRNAIVKVLQDLTGRTPIIYEPLRARDTGGYGIACGYGVAGAYGSKVVGPFQAWVTAFRPLGTGIPYVNGYGNPAGGYGVPSRAVYASLNMVQGGVSDADIYAAIDGVKPVGTTIWARITG